MTNLPVQPLQMNLDAERDRLLALAEKATPGPWEYETGPAYRGRHHTVIAPDKDDPDSADSVCECYEGLEAQQEANAKFIAAAHDMAALIRAQAAEIERLRADAERYYAIQSRFDIIGTDDRR